jgi:mannose-6-phosphate isomerase-like protein (cupin superfamily)
MPVKRYGDIPVETLPQYPGNYYQTIVDESESRGIMSKIQRFDEEVPLHSHPEIEHVFYFLDGRGTIIIDGVEEPFEPNSAVFIPAGAEHRLVAEAGGATIVFVSHRV